jgi:para-nitrobenzyl esterase
MSVENPRAVTPFGRFVGRYEDKIKVFRGIRYAEPPVGERRFRNPAELPLNQGDIDAGEDGPIPPQLPSRLENAMGPIPGLQGEDCLRLTIWVPSEPVDEKLPVLVWFHGGAFMTGAGSLPYYSGLRFSRTERTIVIAVSSRLGPFGYARIKGLNEGNLGLHDQLASLRWIQRSIASFGGDPDDVTIAGQSAGAFAVLSLAVMKQARGLFKRAILQSGPFELAPDPSDKAEARGQILMDIAASGRIDLLREAPVQRILEASGAVARHFSTGPGDFTPPYVPCIDGELIHGPLLNAVEDGAASWCAMIAGYTREECTVFSLIDPALSELSHAGLREMLKSDFGGDVDEVIGEYRALRGNRRYPRALLSDAMTEVRFVIPTLKLAELQRKAGQPIYLYQFDWQSPKEEFGANHCIELPFLFGEFDAWENAPMFRGANQSDYDHIGDTLRGYWGAFARSGSVAKEELLKWPVYDETRVVMRFDRYITPAVDPSGTRWRRALQLSRC